MGTKSTNADGLIQHYGTRDTENLPRAIPNSGQLKEIKYVINYADANANGTAITSNELGGAGLPDGAYLVSAKLYIDTAFTSGGAATLSIGTYDSKASTAVDADGIDATIAVAAMTDDTVITCDGAQVDTVLSNSVTTGADMMIAAIYGTAVFTAGNATLICEYFVP